MKACEGFTLCACVVYVCVNVCVCMHAWVRAYMHVDQDPLICTYVLHCLSQDQDQDLAKDQDRNLDKDQDQVCVCVCVCVCVSVYVRV